MKKYGFNMIWMFSYYGKEAKKPDKKQLDFIAKHGFNFIRVPMDYRFWTNEFDYLNPNEKVFEKIDSYIKACQERGLHMSLNMHRAPGYCINNNNIEKHNLWKDKIAQDAYVFLWETFAKRYKGISSKDLSFDLLNEPPDIGQYGFTRKIHEKVMRRTIQAIRDIDPSRLIVLNGIEGGGIAIPELADADVIHSGRGYAPYQLTHYKASWAPLEDGYKWIKPVYPGVMEDEMWDKSALVEYYRPWREVEDMGVEVHIGEFGCYDKTPNDVAMRWFKDLINLYNEYKWGFALWNFAGAFGIVNHGRPGTKYELIDGFKVDRELMELLLPPKLTSG
ncbi:MAG: glycoside hydrolase family 5 protein [Oscillospiraceae bacterium]|jgi:aryl-phospho-beta-D-glucosidase BglC (GH1 family)|nr:glycoside hydrolase family 5 protein [Oscillospiraceae bacterium]